MSPPSRRGRAVPAAAAGLLTTALCWLFSARQWARFESPSWDLGIFTQVVRGWAGGQLPVVDIKSPGYMILGDHFHPLLALLAPVYRLWPSGMMLLAAQAVLIGISTAVLTWAASRHLGSVPGALIGMAYGLSWGLQSAVASQFHEVALALPFLAASLAALVRRDHRAAALWALPLLLIKEDLGLTVAMIGVVIAIRSSRWLGAALTVGGVAAFWLTTSLILPALNPDGVWAYAEDSITSQIISDPGGAIGSLFTGFGQKVLLVVAVFAITGFLSLRSPLALITLPTFAWRLTSDVPFHWSLDWHYSLVLMPIVFAALVDTLLRPGWKRWALRVGAGALALALVLTWWFPLKRLIEPDLYTGGVRAEGAEQALALVPDGATVVTDITLMAYLAPRADVYWLGNENPAPEYVVLYRDAGIWGGDPPVNAEDWAEERFPGDDYTQILEVDGFLVAERVAP